MNDDRQSLEEAIGALPQRRPRPGLKQEMLANILAEATAAERKARQRKRFLTLPALGVTLSTVGSLASLAFLIYLMPDAAKEPDAGRYVSGGSVSIGELRKEEVQLRKAERENQILKQLTPDKNGIVVGEGVEISLHDPHAAIIRRGMLTDNVPADFDLYRLVQELYEHGGVLVSINGIMVEPYTKIITRGALTEINNRRINSPFMIKVIGDSDQLYGQLHADDSVLHQIRNNQALDFEVAQSDELSIALK